MPDILIDITRLLGRRIDGLLPTGVDRVSLAYVQCYRQRARAIVRFAGRQLVFSSRDSLFLFDGLLESASGFMTRVRLLVAKQLCLLPDNIPAGTFLFNTGHSGLEKAEYARFLQKQKVRPVFFLHDLIPISHPEYCRPGEKSKHIRRIDTMLTYGAGIICNSRMTQDVLASYSAQAGKTLPPVATALLASVDLAAPAGQPPLQVPYFVMLGTIESRKNHLLMLQVWRNLAQTMGAHTPKLVLIGRRGWECENVIDMLERCDILKDHVIELSSCSDNELSTWLHHARALLFPSFIEGFGIPLMEAISLGTPVIASDIAVFHEIAGAIPEYVNPTDGPGWQARIMDYMAEDSAVRNAQLSRMQGFRAPTWGQHFDIVDHFLEQLP